MDLQIGTAVRDVSPDYEVPLRGYGQPEQRRSTGVHDPLTVRAVALSDGAETVGVAVADVITVDRSLTAAVTRAIGGSDGPYDEVVVAATHTHSGPWVPMPAIDRIKDFRLPADLEGAVDRFRSDLRTATEAALTDAAADLVPATMRVGRAENHVTAVNRRTEWTRMADCLGPGGGRIDPELLTVEFETAAGARTILLNYACHPVCGTNAQRRLSADWPGVARREIEDEFDDATAMVLTGAAGDINPRDRYPETSEDEAVYAYTREIGEEVAETAIAAVEAGRDRPAREAAPITTQARTVRLPVKSAPDLPALEAWIDRLDDEIAGYEAADNDEAARLADGLRRHAEARARVARWPVDAIPAGMVGARIGPLGLVTAPGEALVQHGLDFKAAAPAEALLVVGYANQNVGYIPTLDELEVAGYEVRASPLAPEGISRFRETALELLC